MNNCLNNYNIYNRAEYGRKEKKVSRLALVVEFLLSLCEAIVELLERPMVRMTVRAVIGFGLAVVCYFFVGAVLNGAIGAFRAVLWALASLVWPFEFSESERLSDIPVRAHTRPKCAYSRYCGGRE